MNQMVYNRKNILPELKKYYGFDSFRKGQEEVISRVLSGHSTVAIFPTGAGKSLCYQLPAQLLNGLTVVVSPLISLMHDQLEFLQNHNVKSAALDSTLSRDEYQKTLDDAVNGRLKVLMISIERLKNERFRSYFSRMNISLLVVDEAHCISEWGHNFRPEYLKIDSYCREFNIPQVLLLTATATINVEKDMCAKLSIEKDNCIRTGFYRENLFLKVTPIESKNKLKLLTERLLGTKGSSTIVYVTLQKSATDVASALVESGINAAAFHAGLDSNTRSTIQSKFMAGSIDCVVATIAFGMGVDKSDIRQVFHYDLPKSIEGYSQEIGRAGRDGNKAYCEVFANLDGVTTLENFVYGDTPSLDSIKLLLSELSEAEGLWEIKLLSLSNLVNIRSLTLKTLLVYLEMEGIITPAYSYFSEYQFKTKLSKEEILKGFNNERQQYLSNLFGYTTKKRTWVSIELDQFLENSGGDRKRAISALEYLDKQNLIELSAKQMVEVYKINTTFNIGTLAEKLTHLFSEKESSEIKKIGNLIDFFRSETCLSNKLSTYFGENKGEYRCGHCSVCNGNGKVVLSSKNLKPLENIDLIPLITPFQRSLDDNITPEIITKFLCGISMPLFTKVKARKLAGFNSLASYQYSKVLEIVKKQRF